MKRGNFSRKGKILMTIAFIAVSSFITWWFEFRITPAGTYSKHGISFDYPKGTEILSEGGDLNSSEITCMWRDDAKYCVFTVEWIKRDTHIPSYTFAKYSLFFWTSDLFSNFEGVDEGESTLKGHTLYYRLFEYDRVRDSLHLHMIIATTYFGELEKEYVFLLSAEYETVIERLQVILETFTAS